MLFVGKDANKVRPGESKYMCENRKQPRGKEPTMNDQTRESTLSTAESVRITFEPDEAQAVAVDVRGRCGAKLRNHAPSRRIPIKEFAQPRGLREPADPNGTIIVVNRAKSA